MALQESFELSDGTGAAIYGTTWGMQSWTTGSAYTISDVALYCYKYGSCGNVKVSIRETTDGKPSGDDLCSVTVAEGVISDFPTRAWYTFTFDTSYALDDATQYAIVFRATSGNAANYFGPFGYGSTGYAGGGYATSTNSGSGWGTVSTANDMDFRTYGGAALPGKPTTPTPTDTASDITLHDTTGIWVSGGNTDSYNVYYGTLSGFLELVEEGVTDLSLALVEGNFSVYGKISYWRVDAVNIYGTTVGDEWYFTTMLFGPPLPTGVTLDHSGGAGGVPTGTATGENNMITVRKLVAAARNKIFYEV